MAQIIGVLKGDTVDVFDFACHHGKRHTKDLGLILERMRHHYCGTLTFWEQWNTIENMRQKSHESAADFLVRVSGAVDGVARDCKGMISQHEIKALLLEVFINRVQEEYRHVLYSEMARYRELMEEQMYNAVKRHKAYLGRTKHLRGGGITPTTPQKSTPLRASNGSFKPRFQKTMAFMATPLEEPDPTSAGSEFDATEESASNADIASDDHSGLYIPDFLREANDGEWGLMIRMARAIQVDEQQQKHCFICQSPDHFVRNCPQAKNVQRPLQPKGASQNNNGSKSQSTGTNLSVYSTGFSPEGGGLVRKARSIPCLNPDPFTCLIGPKNWGEALIDDKLTTCLLDNGAQLNFVTPEYAVK